jgi:hypothetical protein
MEPYFLLFFTARGDNQGWGDNKIQKDLFWNL